MHDTATVSSGNGSFTPSGSVTYQLYSGLDCQQGNEVGGSEQVAMSGGLVPDSSETAPLQAGSYSYQAVYSGDGNYAGSTGPCEPFSVDKGSSSTATTVFDAATNAAWSGTESTGASAYDTASVSTSDGFTATGSVSYRFFSNGDCSGDGTAAGTVTLDGAGNVPNSDTKGPLAAGSYSFQAVYSGDGNYAGSTGPCEPFSVDKGSSSTATTVFDAATNAAWSGTESTGASAYDTASVSTSDGFTATGSVSYRFFSNGDCSGDGTAAGTVTLDGAGNVPTRTRRGRWRQGPTASRRPIRVTATTPARPAPVGRSPSVSADLDGDDGVRRGHECGLVGHGVDRCVGL